MIKYLTEQEIKTLEKIYYGLMESCDSESTKLYTGLFFAEFKKYKFPVIDFQDKVLYWESVSENTFILTLLGKIYAAIRVKYLYTNG